MGDHLAKTTTARAMKPRPEEGNAFDELVGVSERQKGSTECRERRADEHRAVAVERNAAASNVDGLRMLANGAKRQPERRPVENEHRKRGDGKRAVDKGVLPEKRFAEERQIAEPGQVDGFGNVDTFARGGKIGAKQERRQAEAQQVDGRADHDLVRLDRDGEERKQQSDENTCRDCRGDPEQDAPASEGGGEAGKGARQHRAFEADIEDSCAFGKHFADGCEYQWRRQPP